MLLPQTRNIGLPMMNLMRFKGLPILQQLHIEEQLLRTSSENWCIINDGTNDPTIVMGVSGHILDQSCLGVALCTAKSFKELVISVFVKMARGHLDFICRLNDYMPRSTFIDKTVEAAGTQFSLRSLELEAIETCLETEFRPSTRFLTSEELEVAAAVAGQ
ncbi:transcription factor TCP15-like [Hibiscus syriacus]|uniref:Transcription factor TCP15-like n=1 Tax=Hibiscus syriacus TaxID=106335 RepID=A0A6A2XSB9_HIBSY|nr:transcription factor TCP15-like [Hibiscus syriacus]